MNKGKLEYMLKLWLPPILRDGLYLIRNYISFYSHRRIVAENSKLKKRYEGSRCFILGSGPSIKGQDLSLLADENIIALNNFFVHPLFGQIVSGSGSKFLLTAPIHLPQTADEWIDWFEHMNSKLPDKVTILFGLSKSSLSAKNIVFKRNLFSKNKKYWYYVGVDSTSASFKMKDSYLDITKPILMASAASVYAIIFAIYMGFSEIYLLGMDHDYFLYENEKNMRFYNDAKHQKNELYRTFGDSFYVDEFLRQYNIFSQYSILDKYSSSHVYNASAGGVCRVFSKVKYEDLFV